MSSDPPPRRLTSTQTLSNWFQVGASLAVVFSIGLLVFELEQQRELAQAQFIVEAQGLRMATYCQARAHLKPIAQRLRTH